jgi:hypothetical protein
MIWRNLQMDGAFPSISLLSSIALCSRPKYHSASYRKLNSPWKAGNQGQVVVLFS